MQPFFHARNVSLVRISQSNRTPIKEVLIVSRLSSQKLYESTENSPGLSCNASILFIRSGSQLILTATFLSKVHSESPEAPEFERLAQAFYDGKKIPEDLSSLPDLPPRDYRSFTISYNCSDRTKVLRASPMDDPALTVFLEDVMISNYLESLVVARHPRVEKPLFKTQKVVLGPSWLTGKSRRKEKAMPDHPDDPPLMAPETPNVTPVTPIPMFSGVIHRHSSYKDVEKILNDTQTEFDNRTTTTDDGGRVERQAMRRGEWYEMYMTSQEKLANILSELKPSRYKIKFATSDDGRQITIYDTGLSDDNSEDGEAVGPSKVAPLNIADGADVVEDIGNRSRGSTIDLEESSPYKLTPTDGKKKKNGASTSGLEKSLSSNTTPTDVKKNNRAQTIIHKAANKARQSASAPAKEQPNMSSGVQDAGKPVCTSSNQKIAEDTSAENASAGTATDPSSQRQMPENLRPQQETFNAASIFGVTQTDIEVSKAFDRYGPAMLGGSIAQPGPWQTVISKHSQKSAKAVVLPSTSVAGSNSRSYRPAPRPQPFGRNPRRTEKPATSFGKASKTSTNDRPVSRPAQSVNVHDPTEFPAMPVVEVPVNNTAIGSEPVVHRSLSAKLASTFTRVIPVIPRSATTTAMTRPVTPISSQVHDDSDPQGLYDASPPRARLPISSGPQQVSIEPYHSVLAPDTPTNANENVNDHTVQDISVMFSAKSKADDEKVEDDSQETKAVIVPKSIMNESETKAGIVPKNVMNETESVPETLPSSNSGKLRDAEDTELAGNVVNNSKSAFSMNDAQVAKPQMSRRKTVTNDHLPDETTTSSSNELRITKKKSRGQKSFQRGQLKSEEEESLDNTLDQEPSHGKIAGSVQLSSDSPETVTTPNEQITIVDLPIPSVASHLNPSGLSYGNIDAPYKANIESSSQSVRGAISLESSGAALPESTSLESSEVVLPESTQDTTNNLEWANLTSLTKLSPSKRRLSLPPTWKDNRDDRDSEESSDLPPLRRTSSFSDLQAPIMSSDLRHETSFAFSDTDAEDDRRESHDTTRLESSPSTELTITPLVRSAQKPIPGYEGELWTNAQGNVVTLFRRNAEMPSQPSSGHQRSRSSPGSYSAPTSTLDTPSYNYGNGMHGHPTPTAASHGPNTNVGHQDVNQSSATHSGPFNVAYTAAQLQPVIPNPLATYQHPAMVMGVHAGPPNAPYVLGFGPRHVLSCGGNMIVPGHDSSLTAEQTTTAHGRDMSFECEFCKQKHLPTCDDPCYLCPLCGMKGLSAFGTKYCSRACLLSDAYYHWRSCSGYRAMDTFSDTSLLGPEYVWEPCPIKSLNPGSESSDQFRQKAFSMFGKFGKDPDLVLAHYRKKQTVNWSVLLNPMHVGDYQIFKASRSGEPVTRVNIICVSSHAFLFTPQNMLANTPS